MDALTPTDVLTIIIAVIVVSILAVLAYINDRKQKEERERLKQELEEKRRVEMAVYEHSPALIVFRERGSEIPKAHNIKERYEHTFVAKSKQAFDFYDFPKNIQKFIAEHKGFFETIRDRCRENKDNWKYVMDGIEDAQSDPIPDGLLDEIGTDEETFIREENGFVSLIRRSEPFSDPEFAFILTYTSPRGQNTYRKEQTLDLDDLEYYFARIAERERYMETAAYQRSIMTPKMRMDIMRMDGFRCCLCGRNQREGAQLEVDHFIPVSKGGLTEPNNLWTLCRDCNGAKSNYTIDEMSELFEQTLAERNG